MGFDKLKDTLIEYNQFKKSRLQTDIMRATNCNYKTAFNYGESHCNLLSTWALLYCQDIINMSYEEFFETLLKKGYTTVEGWLQIDKPELFKKLNINCEIIKHNTIPSDLSPGKFYQIAINDKHHFMAAATSDDSNLYLFDTNDRPYGAEFIKALSVKKDKITWIKQFKGA